MTLAGAVGRRSVPTRASRSPGWVLRKRATSSACAVAWVIGAATSSAQPSEAPPANATPKAEPTVPAEPEGPAPESAAPSDTAAPASGEPPAPPSEPPSEPPGPDGASASPPQDPNAQPGASPATQPEPAAPQSAPPPVVASTYSDVDDDVDDELEEAPPDSRADEAGSDAGPFRQFTTRISLVVGSGSAVGQSYFILGGGLGFFVYDGVEVGFRGDVWLGNEPVIGTLTPQLTYVFHMVPVVKPYAGAFFSHTIVGDQTNYNSAGPRAGINVVFNDNAFIGLGAAFEFIIDCGSTGFSSCESVNPEIVAAFAF